MMWEKVQELAITLYRANDPLIVFSKTAILTIIFFLSLRHLLSANILQKVKAMDRPTNKTIRTLYIKNAWLGWVFFLVALCIIELLFLKAPLLLNLFSFDQWFLVSLIALSLGCYFHLYAVAKALTFVLNEKIQPEST